MGKPYPFKSGGMFLGKPHPFGSRGIFGGKRHPFNIKIPPFLSPPSPLHPPSPNARALPMARVPMISSPAAPSAVPSPASQPSAGPFLSRAGRALHISGRWYRLGKPPAPFPSLRPCNPLWVQRFKVVQHVKTEDQSPNVPLQRHLELTRTSVWLAFKQAWWIPATRCDPAPSVDLGAGLRVTQLAVPKLCAISLWF